MIALITGATNGIGKEIAFELLSLDYELIFIVRNKSLADSRIKSFKTLFPRAKIHTYVTDLTDILMVKEVANKISYDFPNIDLIIQNAGSLFSRKDRFNGIYDKTILVNSLSPYILMKHLIKNLVKSKNPRVYQITSMTANKKNFPKNILEIEKSNKIQIYGYSKMIANLMYFKFSNSNKKVKYIFLDPRIVYTNATINMIPKFLRFISPIMLMFARKPKYIAKEFKDSLFENYDENIVFLSKGKVVKHAKHYNDLNLQQEVINYLDSIEESIMVNKI